MNNNMNNNMAAQTLSANQMMMMQQVIFVFFKSENNSFFKKIFEQAQSRAQPRKPDKSNKPKQPVYGTQPIPQIVKKLFFF